jgi:hypothetical protein
MADHPHTIDRGDDATGENLVEQITAVGDYLVALEPYRASVKRWPKDKITAQPRSGDRAKLAGLAQSSARQNVEARPSNQPEPDTKHHHKPSRPVVMIIECYAAKNLRTAPVPDLLFYASLLFVAAILGRP